jgi:hypothetical protein
MLSFHGKQKDRDEIANYCAGFHVKWKIGHGKHSAIIRMNDIYIRMLYTKYGVLLFYSGCSKHELCKIFPRKSLARYFCILLDDDV